MRNLKFCHICTRTIAQLPKNIIHELKARKLIKTILPNIKDNTIDYKFPINIYTGIDLTAKNVHLGNLLIILALIRWQRHGHQSHIVLGEATTKIGDPSGRETDRISINEVDIKNNFESIKKTILSIFDNHENYFWDNNIHSSKLIKPTIWSNLEWYEAMNPITFLTDIGSHFRMGTMLRKEYIRSRIKSDDESAGLSFREFTYQIFQAYDWLHLYRTQNCIFQIGGSDQMGNMEAGYELIKKVTGQTAHCITTPLIKSRSGEKHSKSVGNVVWLDSTMTSPFTFYQHFVRLPDDKLNDYLNYYTFWDANKINAICSETNRFPEKRIGQTLLAEAMTTLVHGPDVAADCAMCSQLIYGDKISVEQLKDLDIPSLCLILKYVDSLSVLLLPNNALKIANTPTDSKIDLSSLTVGTLMTLCPIIKSENEIKEYIEDKSVRINGQRIVDFSQPFEINIHAYTIDRLKGAELSANLGELVRYISLLKIGKRRYIVIKWIEINHNR